jgi:hypothetical protein
MPTSPSAEHGAADRASQFGRRAALLLACAGAGVVIAAYERWRQRRSWRRSDQTRAASTDDQDALSAFESLPKFSLDRAHALCTAPDPLLAEHAVDVLMAIRQRPDDATLRVGCQRLVELGLRNAVDRADEVLCLGLNGLHACGRLPPAATLSKRFGDPTRFPKSLQFLNSLQRAPRPR